MNNNLQKISITFFVIMVLLSIVQWICLQKNISSIKEDLVKNYEEIEKGRVEPIVLDFKKTGKNQVLINAEGLRRINEQFKLVNKELEMQSVKLESTVDKDISRLGLYMAMGIGFMTLFGIFVPILVNVLSTQDLRDKQKGIDDDFKEVKSDFVKLKEKEENIVEAIENSAKALVDSKEALEKSKEVNTLVQKQKKIEKRVKNMNPEICNLALHSSIMRFFNVRPIQVTNAINKKDNTIFVNYLIDIQTAFSRCKSDKNHLIKNSQFQETVKDFILFLRTESLLQSALSNKSIFNQIESLAHALEEFSSVKEIDKITCYVKVDNIINQLKIIIENQYVKN